LQSISPGLVKTEMPPQKYLENNPYLNSEDIADGVVYVLGTPPHVQVCQNSACELWQDIIIFDIRCRPRHSLSNRRGAADHSFQITILSWRWKDNVPPPYGSICTKLHSLKFQKMATVKCNFIYSRTVAYIHTLLIQ